MRNLVYISNAKTLLHDDELLEILNEARRYNEKYHITGVLLYSEGTFIQVLEGKDEDVDFVFQKIEQDTRHKNVLVLMDEPLPERNFPGWAMGFTSINAATSQQLIGDLTTTSHVLAKSANQTSVAMLKAFIESNHLVINH
jgi:hypothetical protein